MDDTRRTIPDAGGEGAGPRDPERAAAERREGLLLAFITRRYLDNRLSASGCGAA